MSTRSEIHIYGKRNELYGEMNEPFIRLYHHFDGYPNGVGCSLMEEVYPKLMSSNINTAEDIAYFLASHIEDGYEFTEGPHPDIEFLYEINVPAKTIKCFKGHYKTHNYRGHTLKRLRFDKYLEYDLKAMFLPLNKRVKYA